jgi:hypothetical protein
LGIFLPRCLAVSKGIGTLVPKELITRLPVDIVATMPAVCHRIALYVKATKPYVQDCSYRAKTLNFEHLLELDSANTIFPTLREMLLVSESDAVAIYTARCFKELYGAGLLVCASN